MTFEEIPDVLKSKVLRFASHPILSVCKVGEGGATQRPFFHPIEDENVTPHFEEEQTHNVPLPKLIEETMVYFDSTVELYLKHWTIMSIDEMKRLKQGYEENGQNLVQPFAFQYHGMGHVKVMAYDPVHDVTFTYMDGGSNGYDRHDNYVRVVNFTKEDIASFQIDVSLLYRDE